MMPLPIGIRRPHNGRKRVTIRISSSARPGEIAVRPDSAGVIVVAAGARATPCQIDAAMRQQHGLAVRLLRVASSALLDVELVDPHARLPEGWCWRQPVADLESDFAPWQQTGWFDRMMRVVASRLQERGIETCGVAWTERSTSLTLLAVIPTRVGRLWLKAVPPLFGHEGPLIERMSSGYESNLPHVLATGAGWWLAQEFPPAKPGARGDPMVVLSQLQRTSLPLIDELRGMGLPDRLLAMQRSRIARITARHDRLDAVRATLLTQALGEIERTGATLDAMGGGPSLVHGDVSPGNVRWTGSDWLIYDWTDACISHPFTDLASPMSYVRAPRRAMAMTTAFLAEWRRYLSTSADMDHLGTMAWIAGSAHQVITYDMLLDATPSQTADQAGRDELFGFLIYWVDILLRSTRL